MAECLLYTCDNCTKSIETWSDGNPYYITESGHKKYAYHPNHDLLEKCIGNDSPHLCLNCGNDFMVDSRSPIAHCPQCNSKDIVDTWDLEGKSCPFCQSGVFSRDLDYYCIS